MTTHSGRELKPLSDWCTLDEFAERTKSALEVEQAEEMEVVRLLQESRSLKAIEEAGLCIRNCMLSEVRSGLYGRMTLVFSVPASVGKSHSMSTGDIVEISVSGNTVGGVVSTRRRNTDSGGDGSLSSSLSVILNRKVPAFGVGGLGEDWDDPSLVFSQFQIRHRYTITKLVDTLTFQRYIKCLDRLSSSNNSGLVGRGLALREFLFASKQDGLTTPSADESTEKKSESIKEDASSSEEGKTNLSDAALVDDLTVEDDGGTKDETERKDDDDDGSRLMHWNKSQRLAIDNAVKSDLFFMIHGPPGTGKTTTIVEVIRQHVFQNNNNNDVGCSTPIKILACAPSNIAVDNMIIKLHECNERVKRDKSSQQSGNERVVSMVRVGHPARILPQVMGYTLDHKVKYESEDREIIEGIREELTQIYHELDNDHSTFQSVMMDSNSNSHSGGDGSSSKATSKQKKGKQRSSKKRSSMDKKSKGKKMFELTEKKKLLSKSERKQRHRKVKELRKDLNDYEQKIVNRVIDGCDVVFCTLTGAMSKEVCQRTFDLCVIDEAGQGLEIACWIPMLLCRKCILAGDHRQLPPTIKSDRASIVLGKTLFDRCQSRLGRMKEFSVMLDVQYRMNELICSFSSQSMYHSRLKSDDSVRKHVLFDLNGILSEKDDHSSDVFKKRLVQKTCDTVHPLVMIDTSSLDECNEDEIEQSGALPLSDLNAALSKSNLTEAKVVCTHIKQLMAAGIRSDEIAVITPYRAQVKLIAELIFGDGESAGRMKAEMKGLEIGTVDGFQGREKEAIILSFVRSNDDRMVGFLSEERRTNVAISRARRHCCIVVDSNTVSSDKYLRSLVDYCYECADIRNPSDYLIEGDSGDVEYELESMLNDESYFVPVAEEPPRIKDFDHRKRKKKKSSLKKEKKKESDESKEEEGKKKEECDTPSDSRNEDGVISKGISKMEETDEEPPMSKIKKSEMEEVVKKTLTTEDDSNSNDNNNHTLIHSIMEQDGIVNDDDGNDGDQTSSSVMVSMIHEDESKERTEEEKEEPDSSIKDDSLNCENETIKDEDMTSSSVIHVHHPSSEQLTYSSVNSTTMKPRKGKSKAMKKKGRSSHRKGPPINGSSIRWGSKKAEMEAEKRKKDEQRRQKSEEKAAKEAAQKYCSFAGCKNRIHLIKTRCRFCQKLFCTSHGNPLFHSSVCEKKLKKTFDKQRGIDLRKIRAKKAAAGKKYML